MMCGRGSVSSSSAGAAGSGVAAATAAAATPAGLKSLPFSSSRTKACFQDGVAMMCGSAPVSSSSAAAPRISPKPRRAISASFSMASIATALPPVARPPAEGVGAGARMASGVAATGKPYGVATTGGQAAGLDLNSGVAASCAPAAGAMLAKAHWLKLAVSLTWGRSAPCGEAGAAVIAGARGESDRPSRNFTDMRCFRPERGVAPFSAGRFLADRLPADLGVPATGEAAAGDPLVGVTSSPARCFLMSRMRFWMALLSSSW